MLLYWVMRIWLVASWRGLDDDPVVYALTNPISLLTGALVARLALLATFIPAT